MTSDSMMDLAKILQDENRKLTAELAAAKAEVERLKQTYEPPEEVKTPEQMAEDERQLVELFDSPEMKSAIKDMVGIIEKRGEHSRMLDEHPALVADLSRHKRALSKALEYIPPGPIPRGDARTEISRILEGKE